MNLRDAGRGLRARSAAVLVALGVLATGFAPAAASDGDRARRLPWERCDFDARLECTTVAVPLDHARPGGERIELAVSRLRSDGRARGVLIPVNGGPGGNEGMGRRAPLRFADSPLRKAYDLIGVDLRGMGGSSPLRCETTTATARFDSRPPDSEFGALAADARASEEACARAGGDLRRHVNTSNVARDLDAVRAALGERKINFVGYAYGTYVGAVYGTLFPHRLDRSVLDSVRHPDWTWRQQFMSQALSIRKSVDAWAAWAGQRDGALDLGGSGRAVMAKVERVADRLADTPAGGMNRTGFDTTVGNMAVDRARWGELAGLVRSLDQGGPPVRAEVAQRYAGAGGGLRPGLLEAATCETPWPRDPTVYERDMRVFRERYPYGLGVLRAQPWVCAFRADSPERPPRIRNAGYPAGLVVQTEADPQTPPAGGEAMARRLGHRMVTVADDGSNEVYGRRGYRCVDDIVDRYLLTGKLPRRARTTCAGVERPDIPVG